MELPKYAKFRRRDGTYSNSPFFRVNNSITYEVARGGWQIDVVKAGEHSYRVDDTCNTAQCFQHLQGMWLVPITKEEFDCYD